jgi:hypothetical protein
MPRAAFLVVLVLGVGLGAAHGQQLPVPVAKPAVTAPVSQRPSPSAGEASSPPQTQPGGSNQPPSADQRGTEQTPLVVKTMPAPKTQAEAAQDAEDRKGKASSDWWGFVFNGWTTIFTGLLVAVGAGQVILFLVQLRYIRESLDDAKKAADAAMEGAKAASAGARAADASAKATKESVEVLRDVERAHIWGGGPLEPKTSNNFKLFVDNYGKTPGLLTDYAVGFCGTRGDIPKEPNYSIREGYHDWIKPDTMNWFLRDIPLPFINDIFIFGRFWYEDIVGGKHSVGFILTTKEAIIKIKKHAIGCQ